MKKLATAALLLATAACARAQGVPASVTSITPRNPTPGVPASVTSFSAFHPPASTGFTAFNPPPSTSFTAFHQPGLPAADINLGVSFGRDPRFRAGFHHRHRVLVAPVYYPVYYPVYSQPEPEPQPEPQPAADLPSGNALDRELWSRAAERSDRSLDRRDAYLSQEDPRYGEHYLDRREQRREDRAAAEPTAEPAPAAPPAPPETALVLVLKDGTTLELANYAIVGQTIFDFSAGPRRKKIALAELDLPATAKANDDRGFDFRLPAAR